MAENTRARHRRVKTWTYVVDAGRDPATGKRRQRTKGGFPTKRMAEEAMRTAFPGASTGHAGAPAPKLGEYLAEWLETGEHREADTEVLFGGPPRLQAYIPCVLDICEG